MKIQIELVEEQQEDELIIRCGHVDDKIQKIQKYILEVYSNNSSIVFYKQNQEFYFPLNNVLFFETEGEHIYAHTANEEYRIKFRLYELEEMLPTHFVRSSKSTIINMLQVHSITRNLTTSSLMQFIGSHKQVYVSRHYYKVLRLRLKERSSYEK